MQWHKHQSVRHYLWDMLMCNGNNIRDWVPQKHLWSEFLNSCQGVSDATVCSEIMLKNSDNK
jgi:hypothetical protein